MTRDELIAAAIRVCTEAATRNGVVSATLEDARAVVAVVVDQAFKTTEHKRTQATLRKRAQREREREERDQSATVPHESRGPSRESHSLTRDKERDGPRDSCVTERDKARDTPNSDQSVSVDLISGEDQERRERESSSSSENARTIANPVHLLSRGERDQRVTPEQAEASEPRALRVAATDSSSRASALLRIFERVAHAGKAIGDYKACRQLLEALLPALDDRDSDQPEAFFERVLKSYTAAKHAKRKQPALHHFCADFAQWADQMALDERAAAAGAVARPSRSDRLKQLARAVRSARDWERDATDRAERAYAGQAVAAAESDLVSEFGDEALAELETLEAAS